jgi:hypothetical protein
LGPKKKSKHWKKGTTLEVIGTMPPELNNGNSDRLVVKTLDGDFEDVLKSTLIRIETHTMSEET